MTFCNNTILNSVNVPEQRQNVKFYSLYYRIFLTKYCSKTQETFKTVFILGSGIDFQVVIDYVKFASDV